MAENSGTSGSESYAIRGHMVVFHEDSHEYYAVDGARVPSVTELIRRHSELHGLDDYTSVPADGRGRPASQGVTLHEEIERYEKDGTEGSSEEFRNYLGLKSKCRIKVESSMLPVLIFDEAGKPVCAGRLDLAGTVGGTPAIIGIRRTAKLYQGRAALELNLCRIGYIQSYGEKCEKLCVMRLRHGAAEFASVPVVEEAAINLLRECLPSFTLKTVGKAQETQPEAAGSGAAAPQGSAPEPGSGDRDNNGNEDNNGSRGSNAGGEAGTGAGAGGGTDAEHLRDAKWFWWFMSALTAHLLLLMLLTGSVIGWEAALHLVLTFTAACLLVWPVLAATPVTKAAGNPLVLGAAALVLKAIAYACGIFLSGIGDFVSGTGAFVAIAGLVFAAAARGTSVTGNDRTGLYLSGIAYVLCTITEVSCLGSIAGA